MLMPILIHKLFVLILFFLFLVVFLCSFDGRGSLDFLNDVTDVGLLSSHDLLFDSVFYVVSIMLILLSI